MLHKTIPLIAHPNFTKLTALILGYSIWFFGASFQWVEREYTVPICFYQTQGRSVQAPESVVVKISGPRKEMFHLNPTELAIHIDLTNYADGDHEILLNTVNLFLPETLKLVELIPSFISFKIQSISKKSEMGQ